MTTHQTYQIRVKGLLDPKLSAWFEAFAISHTSDGDTLLTGTVIDQAALHGVLARCRDLGVTLISINPLDPAPNRLSVTTAVTTTATTTERGRIEEKAMKNWIHVEASHVIDASPAQVYAVIADYRESHPAILPKGFTPLIVEKGGQGAGTVVRGSVVVFGQEYPFHQEITEPEPGRVLAETDIETGQYTTFTFEPLNGGQQTKLTISSEFPSSGGLMGLMERLTKPGVTRRLYEEELRNVNQYVRTKKIVPAFAK